MDPSTTRRRPDRRGGLTVARFTVSGRLRLTGETVSVTWDDGELEGDPVAVADIRFLVDRDATVGATVTGPFHGATLDPPDGWWVLATVREAFESGGVQIEGELPGPPPDMSIPPAPSRRASCSAS
jgi:hypothetical protein